MRKPIATVLILAAAFVLHSSREATADNMPLIYSDGTIVYGDWGLYRPGAIVPFAENSFVVPVPRSSAGSYFPTNRYDPGAYRSPTPKGPPVPAEPWYSSWGVHSDPAPATIENPNYGPSVIYAPTFEGNRRRPGPR